MPASIRKQLIADHVHLAEVIASKVCFGRRPDDPHWQDVHSAALEALVKAANAFDPARGTAFSTLAWPRLLRAAQRVRIRERAHYQQETAARHSREDDGNPAAERDLWAESDEYRAGLSVSPEELLLQAEARELGEDRLRRLPPELREKVEVVLDGGAALLQPSCVGVYFNRHTGERRTVVRKGTADLVLEAAGVRVGVKDAPAPRGAMNGSSRTARWLARLTPEQRVARNAKNTARKAAARRARRVA